MCASGAGDPRLTWQSEVLVLECGPSVGWMSVARGLFPCVTPSKKYLLLSHGQPRVADGSLCLAVQGIGPWEADAFNLNAEAEVLQRDLAGNAFSANVCFAFLVAALAVV